MKKNIVYLLSGFIFAAGLGISGMLDPQNIKSFLEVLYPETWAPHLLFVLFSATGIYALAYWTQVKCGKSCTSSFQKLPQGKIDQKLFLGALLFGLGWGLTGLCPAPAVARIGLSPLDIHNWIFVLSMFAGFKLQELLGSKK